MFQVFARSWKGLNLSPGERAAMKLVGGVLFTGVGAGVLVALQLFLTGNHDFAYITAAAGGAAAKTLWDTVGKYKSAQTDVPLADPSLVTVPKDTPAPVPLAPPVPMPGLQFTTQVPAPPVLLEHPQFMQPPLGTAPPYTGTYPSDVVRDWSGMTAAVSAQTTLTQVPTP